MSLVNAARNGNINTVRKLLNNGVNVNEPNKHGETPLYLASERGNTEMVKALLDSPGINVDKADSNRYTPLHVATRKSFSKIVKMLLEAGADINKTNVFGYTPLYHASYNGNAKIVKILLEAGADVNKAQNEGMTPLFIASTYGNFGAVKLLLAAPGIDVNKASNAGYTPLHVSSEECHPEVVNLLLKAGADPFIKTKHDKRTALDLVMWLNSNNRSNNSNRNRNTYNIIILLRKAMGIKVPWRNMNADQRKTFKPILLQRMIAKNASDENFMEPISHINYSLKTLKPVNKGEPKLGGLGLVINNWNKPIRFVNATVLRNSIRRSRNQTVRGVFHRNWSLINVTPEEYQKARKSLSKLSARVKGKRTRKNLKTGRTNRIAANEGKTWEIANLRTSIKKAKEAKKRLNKLM